MESKKVYLSLCSFFILVTCSFGQNLIQKAIVHNNITREYNLYVPDSYDSNVASPLLFNFHGYGSNMGQQIFFGDFRPIADTVGFIMALPQGTLDDIGFEFFNVGFTDSQIDDIGFTAAMIEDIANEYNINLDRIYATGMSNGGFFSYALACQLSDKIAAVASVTGSMTNFTFNNCKPQHPTPILEIHGTNDGIVPYEGALGIKSIPEVIEYWVNYNECNTNPKVETFEDINTDDNSAVEHFIYKNDLNSICVELMKVKGGSHSWPGSFINLPGTNYDIDASKEIWDFFSRYDINGTLGPSAGKETYVSKFSVFPNPAKDKFTILLPSAKTQVYELRTLTGSLIQTEILTKRINEIEILVHNPQILLLKVGDHYQKLIISR